MKLSDNEDAKCKAFSDDDSVHSNVEFSRKYNGFMKRKFSFDKFSKANNSNAVVLKMEPTQVPIVKASIGVQTSLEDLNRIDKSCQWENDPVSDDATQRETPD